MLLYNGFGKPKSKKCIHRHKVDSDFLPISFLHAVSSFLQNNVSEIQCYPIQSCFLEKSLESDEDLSIAIFKLVCRKLTSFFHSNNVQQIIQLSSLICVKPTPTSIPYVQTPRLLLHTTRPQIVKFMYDATLSSRQHYYLANHVVELGLASQHIADEIFVQLVVQSRSLNQTQGLLRNQRTLANFSVLYLT